MKIYSTPPELMEDRRLDPYYYDPLFIEHEQVILSSFPHRESVGDIFHVLDGTHDSVDTRACADNEFAITFLRSQDIGDCLLRPNAGAYLRQSDHVGKCKRSKIFHGDVLLNIMASTGQSCLYFPSYPSEANANRAVGILRSRNVSLSEDEKIFISVLLSSRVGGLELARNLKGSIQQRLNLSDISEVRFPRVASLVCRYIGDKVRQAERLRTFANSLAADLVSRFSLREYIQMSRISKHHPCATKNLAAERLDAQFYLPEHIELKQALQTVSPVSLGTFCQLVSERWKKREPEFLYFEIGSLDVGSGRITPIKTKTIGAASRAQRLLRPWDVLVSTVRPNRKNVGLVTPVSAGNFPLVASTGFAVLRFQDKETAAFFHAWLRSDVATQQLVQWNAGGSYPAIEEEVVPQILVPAFSADTICEIGRKCIAGMQARDLTANLCDAAKLLVEALIERNITEVDLTYAQTQLEQGDDAADRAILGSLYDGGWDVTESRPLFPDLDAYYETVRMVEREQTEVAAI
jgi:type I restriction enzyme, S subunit